MSWRGLAAAALLLLTSATAQAAPVFTFEITPTSGVVGDSFTATVKLDIAGGRSPESFTPPDFPGLTISDTQLNSSTFVDVDPVSGQRETRVVEIRRYVLRAARMGHLTLGPARARIDGQDIESNPVIVDIVPPSFTSVDPDPTAIGGVGAPGYRKPHPVGHPSVFLHAAVDRTDPFVGEQVTVTWLLFLRSEEVTEFRPMPARLDDLWSEKLYDFDTDLRYFGEDVDGEPYQVAIISKKAVFPTRSGKIEIHPFRAKVGVAYAGDKVDVASPSMFLDVKPLPPGAPPGFDPTWIGEWSADAQIDRNAIDAGDGVTLTVRVRGTGAVGRVAIPALRLPGFKLRVPRDRDQRVDTSGGRVSGELVFRFFATPEQGGAQVVPSLRLAYFSPRLGQYQIAETDPLALQVRGDPQTVAGAADDHFIAPDIRLIHDGTTIASISASPVHRQPWFWVIAVLPPLAFAGLLAWERVRRSRAPGGRGRARQRLRQAGLHLRANQAPQFFAELARVLDERLGEALGQPARALTRPQLVALLTERGFPEELIRRLGDELDNCDFARFTPAAAAPEEMRAALERTRTLADDIDRAATEAAAAAAEPPAAEAGP